MRRSGSGGSGTYGVLEDGLLRDPVREEGVPGRVQPALRLIRDRRERARAAHHLHILSQTRVREKRRGERTKGMPASTSTSSTVWSFAGSEGQNIDPNEIYTRISPRPFHYTLNSLTINTLRSPRARSCLSKNTCTSPAADVSGAPGPREMSGPAYTAGRAPNCARSADAAPGWYASVSIVSAPSAARRTLSCVL